MKWTYSLFSLGWLLLLTVTVSGAKVEQTSQEIVPFVCGVSEQRDVAIPDLKIVQPDPVPGPKPLPDPGENPKPKPL